MEEPALEDPKATSGARRLVAVWLSRVFHPFVVATLVLFAVQLPSAQSAAEAAWWTALTFAVVVAPLLLFLVVRVRQGRYQDIDVSVREDRPLLFVLGLSSFVLLLALLALLDAPAIVHKTLQAALVAILAGAVANALVNKLSLHSLNLAGCSTLLLLVFPPAGVALAVVTVLVGWARLHLTRHTLPEVLLGWVVGAVAVGGWMLLAPGGRPGG